MNLNPSLRTLANAHTKHSLRTLKTPFRLQYHTHQAFSQPHGIVFNAEDPAPSIQTHIADVHYLFDRSPHPNLAEYNHLLFEYSRDNRHREALKLFVGIRRSGLSFDGSTFSCVLKACGCLIDKVVGRQVHCQCIKCGYLEDVSVGTSLVDMYMKMESVEDGGRAFDEMEDGNDVSWTSLLAGYVRNGLIERVLQLFSGIQTERIETNSFTFATILGALADEGIVGKVMQVHGVDVKNGFEANTAVSNSLINMYSKSGMVRDARAVFESMEDRDSFTWNGMIAGYVTNGLDVEAFEMFYGMRLAGVKLTQMILAPVIKLCANLKELSFARQLHCRNLKNGLGLITILELHTWLLTVGAVKWMTPLNCSQ